MELLLLGKQEGNPCMDIYMAHCHVRNGYLNLQYGSVNPPIFGDKRLEIQINKWMLNGFLKIIK
jgi:hypothetical protein